MQMLMYPSHTYDVQRTRGAYPRRMPQPKLTAGPGWGYWSRYMVQCYVEMRVWRGAGWTAACSAPEPGRPVKRGDEAQR
jgi:hypothetical protein